ncbi:hypothetical protein LZ31DRAFT_167511 [Colletotrichum somersetense]|nr:hypothetical protein LZ31DRAFT_167511 [Colletotrichum somersetense]
MPVYIVLNATHLVCGLRPTYVGQSRCPEPQSKNGEGIADTITWVAALVSIQAASRVVGSIVIDAMWKTASISAYVHGQTSSFNFRAALRRPWARRVIIHTRGGSQLTGRLFELKSATVSFVPPHQRPSRGLAPGSLLASQNHIRQ